MKENLNIYAAEFFANYHAKVQSISKSGYNLNEMVWDEIKTPSVETELSALFFSELYEKATTELEISSDIEIQFMLQILRQERWLYEMERKTPSVAANEQIVYWLEQFNKNTFSRLFSYDTERFPVHSQEIFSQLLYREKDIAPMHKPSDEYLISTNENLLFTCYEEIGLPISSIQFKTIDSKEGFTQHGGTAFFWEEEEELILAFLRTRADGVNMTVMEAYIILHELGHLLHRRIVGKRQPEFLYGEPSIWTEGVADGLATIATMLLPEEKDKLNIQSYLNQQRYYRIDTAIDLLQITNGGIVQDWFPNSLAGLQYSLNAPISTAVSEKIVQIYMQKGIIELQKFIRNNQGIALQTFINTTISERLAELGICPVK